MSAPTRVAAAVCLAGISAFGIAACGDDSPTRPTPPPPPVVNTPPVVRSLTATPTRLEVRLSTCAGTTPCPTRTTLAATVEDTETAAAQLTYEWSAAGSGGAGLGTFEGSGATVTWIAPDTVPGPQTVDVRLTVVERYASRVGGPIDSENRVSSTVGVRVHDSVKEVGDLATLFLTEFSNSSLEDPQYLVRNFSDSCPGKAAEATDVAANRQNYLILNYALGGPKVTVTFAPSPCGTRTRPEGHACAELTCRWTARCLPGAPANECTPGVVGTTSGNCVLSAIYEREQWYLCDSRYYESQTSGMRWMR